MSFSLPPITIGTQPVPVPLMGIPACTGMVVGNESDNALNVQTGGSTKWIHAWGQDLIPVNSIATGNVATLTPVNIGGPAGDSSVALVTLYGPGEQIPGSYPSQLVRVVAGSLTNQTLTNDGNGRQIVIEMTVAGNTSGFSNIQIWNDGTIIVSGQTASGFQTLFEIAPGNPSAIAAGADNFILDPVSGILQLFAPIQLKHGHQETGHVAGRFVASALSQVHWYPVNFKTVMTNVPSGITLNPDFHQNDTTTVQDISMYGFTLQIQSTVAAGDVYWEGSYTTVGN